MSWLDWFKFGFIRGLVSLCAAAISVVLLNLFSIPTTLTIGYTALGYEGGYNLATVYGSWDAYLLLSVIFWAFGVVLSVCITSGAMYVVGATLASFLPIRFSDLKNAMLAGVLGALVVTILYLVGGYVLNIYEDPMFTFIASVIVPFAIVTEPLYTFVTWKVVQLFGIREPVL